MVYFYHQGKASGMLQKKEDLYYEKKERYL